MILKLLLLTLISSTAADSWTKICKDHPFAAERNSGKVDPYDPKDTNSIASTVKCRIEYDFDYPDQYIEKFCTARFYGFLHSYNIKRDQKRLECIYETDSYCDGDDININGMCYRLHKDAKTLAEAKQICSDDKTEILTLSDKDAAEWILKIHDPNSKHMIPKIWFDTHIDQIESADVWQYSDFSSSKTASALLFRHDFPIPLSFFVPADPTEKHPFYCKKPAKFFPAAFRRYCEIVKKEFKIPAAYHRSTCFMMSMSVHRPKFINGEIDNRYYNEDCNYVEKMKTYAVAPTSRVKFDGMIKAVMSTYPQDATKTPRLVTPGKSKDKARALKLTCKTHSRNNANEFFYLDSDGNDYEVASSNWDARTLRNECADLHRDVIVLAPSSGEKVKGFHLPSLPESLFTSYDYPRFFRGHKICAAGFDLKDIYSTKCEDGWRGVSRDDGTMNCHKAIIDGVRAESKKNILKACQKIGGKFLAGIESAKEQKLIYDMVYEEMKKQGRHYNQGSIMLGMETDNKGFTFRMDSDNSVAYFTKWAKNEPSFGSKNEKCAVMVFKPYNGRWNDQVCWAGKHSNPRYTVVGAVCSKPAEF